MLPKTHCARITTPRVAVSGLWTNTFLLDVIIAVLNLFVRKQDR